MFVRRKWQNRDCPDFRPTNRTVPSRPASRPARSIFHHHRLDYDTILELIPPGASVLDLGCGTGGLLARLRERGHRRIVGIEWDEQAILACVRRGLDVVQADLNKGLPAFADGQFDFVVLSQTLQTVLDVPRVLRDMLRVGRRGIVSFPNVGLSQAAGGIGRSRAGRRGSMPNTASNGTTRPTSARCRSPTSRSSAASRALTIHQQIALDTEADARVHDDPNLNADVAVMVLSR